MLSIPTKDGVRQLPMQHGSATCSSLHIHKLFDHKLLRCCTMAAPAPAAPAAWCYTCFAAGRTGPGEFWVKEFWKDCWCPGYLCTDPECDKYRFNCYLCTDCARFYQVPQAYDITERAWRDMKFGPVGVPYGANATWDSKGVKRTQRHRSDPCFSRARVQHVENEIDMDDEL